MATPRFRSCTLTASRDEAPTPESIARGEGACRGALHRDEGVNDPLRHRKEGGRVKISKRDGDVLQATGPVEIQPLRHDEATRDQPTLPEHFARGRATPSAPSRQARTPLPLSSVG